MCQRAQAGPALLLYSACCPVPRLRDPALRIQQRRQRLAGPAGAVAQTIASCVMRALRRRGGVICPYATKRGVRQDGLPRSRCPPERLEQELQAKLHHARALANFQDLTERRIGEVSVGIRKLRVIPRV